MAGNDLKGRMSFKYTGEYHPDHLHPRLIMPTVLDAWLNFAFSSFVAELNRSLHSVELPLNHAQFAILQKPFIKDGKIQSEIARSLGKDRAAVSRSLNTLEKDGFNLAL
ncbi:MAG: MarR family transcriptional regulator [Bacteroides sp.]|nr:MarR family transcriptional regulator [Bacteroides sp.]